jgi:hypothetical protein
MGLWCAACVQECDRCSQKYMRFWTMRNRTNSKTTIVSLSTNEVNPSALIHVPQEIGRVVYVAKQSGGLLQAHRATDATEPLPVMMFVSADHFVL